MSFDVPKSPARQFSEVQRSSGPSKCDVLKFSPEKLQYLEILQDHDEPLFRKYRNIDLHINLDRGIVSIEGTDGNKIDNFKIEIYELMNSSSDIPLKTSKNRIKLLVSERIKSWLNEQLRQNDLLAVFFIQGGAPRILGRDDLVSLKANDVVLDHFKTSRYSFNDQQVSFFQSIPWSKWVTEC